MTQKLITLTGKPMLPPAWSLGYHQCRWNYLTQEELIEVNENMTKHDIPCDTVWLDIEYSDAKRYFTWDQKKFKEPRKMLENVVGHERRLVTIIDPHVKFDEDFFLYKQATERGVLV